MSDTLKACEGQNEVIVNETDELARQFHDSYEEVAPLYGYTTRNDTRVFAPDSPNGRLMRAVCLQVVGPIIAERNSLQDQRDFAMGEIDRLRKERDKFEHALRVIARMDTSRANTRALLSVAVAKDALGLETPEH